MTDKKTIPAEELKGAAGGYEGPEVETTGSETGDRGVLLASPTISAQVVSSPVTNVIPTSSTQPTALVMGGSGEQKDR